MANSMNRPAPDLKKLISEQNASLAADLSRPLPKEIEPLHNWVLVRRKKRGVTEGGLHVPETAQDKDADGTVIAHGPGRYEAGILVPISVQVGDEVMCGPGSEHFTMPTDAACMLIRDTDIIARRKSGREGMQ